MPSTDTDTLSLHDALPICYWSWRLQDPTVVGGSPFIPPILRAESLVEPLATRGAAATLDAATLRTFLGGRAQRIILQNDLTVIDRKSTRLNSSHLGISYAVHRY